MDGTEILPISAEARGRVRAWIAAQGVITNDIEKTFNADATVRAASDFVLKKGKGRDRARARLTKIFGGTDCAGKRGESWWLPYLAPTERGVVPRNAVIHCGSRGGYGIVQSPVEFTRHSLERLAQRDRNANLTAVVLEAACKAGLLSASAMKREGRFRLAAGDGAFAFEFLPGEAAIIVACTWLHNDAMTNSQELQIIPLGGPGDRLMEHEVWRFR